MSWHQLSIQDIFEKFKSSQEGLSEDQVKRRLEKYGPNALPEQAGRSTLKIILSQFANPFIYLLVIAAVISGLLKEVPDTVFIVVVIFLSTLLAAFQEWKAEQEYSLLQKLIKIKARVRRENKEAEIDSEFLVPGDVVILSEGVRVPADLRLIESAGLMINESLLTGESAPVQKEPEVLEKESVPLADQINMLFAGTAVSRGRGLGVVVATGARSEVGKLSHAVTSTQESKTPLLIRLERFSQQVAYITVAASIFVFGVGMLKGLDLRELFLMTVGLMVAAIPEDLPVIITIALAVGSRRMAKRKVIIRRLSAVEGLGSCNCIASDKTGTLTVNKQTIVRVMTSDGKIYHVSGTGYEGEGELTKEDGSPLEFIPEDVISVACASVLCSDAHLEQDGNKWKAHGDEVDLACLALAYKVSCQPDQVSENYKILKKIPFSSEARFAATLYQKEGKILVALKGALEVFLPHAQNSSSIDAAQLEKAEHDFGDQGYRVIAVAQAILNTSDYQGFIREPEKLLDACTLTSLSLFAMIDPLRPEAKPAVKLAQDAGVRVIMITGDNARTAYTLAHELGIAQDREQVMTGTELDKILKNQSREEILRVINPITVFARIAPTQKLNIVKLRKAEGDFVAVTGDGVNDAPALKEAHVGVAMGSGTDIAQDASSTIVTDDNFASIVAGIKQGRVVYSNIRKVVYLLISIGIAQIMFVIASLLLNLPLPLFAAQFLWLNLVTNGVQDVALAFEPGESTLMQGQKHHPSKGIFDARMWEQVLVSSFAMTVIITLFWWYVTSIHADLFYARNWMFLLFVVMLNAQVLNCRSETESFFSTPFFSNSFLWLTIMLSHLLHIACMYIPFMQKVLRVQPVTLFEWAVLLPAGLLIVLIMEIYKSLKKWLTLL